jgi:importin subunit alpha-1
MAIAPLSDTTIANNACTSSVTIDSNSRKVFTVADIPALMSVLSQPHINEATLHYVASGFRKMLSVETNPPVNEVLACGVLPALVQMLQLSDKPKVQFEAAWALTNIASTSETKAIVDADAVQYLTQLLCSADAEVREQCAWCLGNIAGDSSTLRDVVLSTGAMQPLLQNIAQPTNKSLFDNCVWALSNFCRGKPQPRLDLVSPAVPTLAQVLKGENTSAKTDALWALSYISDGDDERIQSVLDGEGILEALIGILGENSGIVMPALRTVGNIVSGSDEQTQAVIDAGLMLKMKGLLNSSKRMICKEACWVLSNIAAGTHAQIGLVLKTRGCMARVVDLAISSEWEVRKEAIWVVSNIATGGTDRQVMSAVEAGAIDAVCSVLNVNDTRMLLVALDAIDSILKLGMKLGKDYHSFVDECDGLAMIETLQEHESDDVYTKAVYIIETFFGAEDEADDENLAPSANGNTFSFGIVQKDLEEDECPASGRNNSQPMATFNFAAI